MVINYLIFYVIFLMIKNVKYSKKLSNFIISDGWDTFIGMKEYSKY